jgi:hypothetical protein
MMKVHADMPAARRWGNDGDHMGWVSGPDLELFGSKIAAKALRISTYPTGVTSVFLLIVADTSFASGMVYDFPEGLTLDARGFDAHWKRSKPPP